MTTPDQTAHSAPDGAGQVTPHLPGCVFVAPHAGLCWTGRTEEATEPTRDQGAGGGLAEVLDLHVLHASMNHCTGCGWRPTAGAGSLTEQHRRHVAEALALTVEEWARAREAGLRARVERVLHGRSWHDRSSINVVPVAAVRAALAEDSSKSTGGE